MKAFISYVIQKSNEHSHKSETIDINSPPYNYSSNVDTSSILDWSEKKKRNLNEGEELVILNFFKLWDYNLLLTFLLA